MGSSVKLSKMRIFTRSSHRNGRLEDGEAWYRAGVANADRESKLVGMPVPWTCDLDRTSRSCRVFCSLQCMACVHWSTQATAAALVHRQMAMRPLWRRSNAEEGHRHWAALCSGELTHTYSGKKDAPPPPLLVTTPYTVAEGLAAVGVPW